jgi:hypothetical protein
MPVQQALFIIENGMTLPISGFFLFRNREGSDLEVL